MALMVGSARHDEHGRYVNGAAGDQTGEEVSTQAFYVHSKGWYVIRPKDVALANKIAQLMLDACNNNNIGYDQNGRYGVINNGIHSKVKTEADCSSLVRACVKEASGKDPGDFNTSSEPTVLARTGLFEDKKSYTSGMVLYNGDILVTKSKGHTVIVVSGNPRETATASSGSTGFSKAVKWTGKITASVLNIRKGAGTGYAKLDSYPQLTNGTKVGVCDSTKASDGTVWYYIKISGAKGDKYGFASSKYIKQV